MKMDCGMWVRYSITALAILFHSANGFAAESVPGYGIFDYARMCRGPSGDLYGLRVVLMRFPPPEGDMVFLETAEGDVADVGVAHINNRTAEISFELKDQFNPVNGPILFKGTVRADALVGTLRYRGGAGGEMDVNLPRREDVRFSC